MRIAPYVFALTLACAGLSFTFSPLQAATPSLGDFCPDLSSTPRCASAASLFLAGKPGDDAIIAEVNAILDRAHGHRTSGKSCDDLEAALNALAAATKDAGSRSLIAGFAENLCTGAGSAIPDLPTASASIGFSKAPPCGTSGQTSSGASGNTSGNTSGSTSGQTSSGASGNTSGSSGSSGSSGQSSGSSGQTSGSTC